MPQPGQGGSAVTPLTLGASAEDEELWQHRAFAQERLRASCTPAKRLINPQANAKRSSAHVDVLHPGVSLAVAVVEDAVTASHAAAERLELVAARLELYSGSLSMQLHSALTKLEETLRSFRAEAGTTAATAAHTIGGVAQEVDPLRVLDHETEPASLSNLAHKRCFGHLDCGDGGTGGGSSANSGLCSCEGCQQVMRRLLAEQTQRLERSALRDTLDVALRWSQSTPTQDVSKAHRAVDAFPSAPQSPALSAVPGPASPMTPMPPLGDAGESTPLSQRAGIQTGLPASETVETAAPPTQRRRGNVHFEGSKSSEARIRASAEEFVRLSSSVESPLFATVYESGASASSSTQEAPQTSKPRPASASPTGRVGTGSARVNQASSGAGVKKLSSLISSEVENKQLTALRSVKGWLREAPYFLDPHDNLSLGPVSLPIAPMNLVTMTVVLLNITFIGWEMNMRVETAADQARDIFWLNYVNLGFTLTFICELALRIYIERGKFLRGSEWMWNVFDAFLVLCGAIETSFAFFTESSAVFMRFLLVLRAVRVLRVFRFVRDLRLMVASIISSFTSLFWAFVLLSFVVYIFGIVIMTSVETHVLENGVLDTVVLLDMYGTIQDCFLSLFKGISGGQDWADLVEPLEKIGGYYVALYLMYVIFVVFGILNILTGIFVDSASHISEIDRELVIQQEMARDRSTLNQIRNVIIQADTDKSGRISVNELEELLRDRLAVQYLKLLDLDVAQTRGLFQLLDIEEVGEVNIEEFVAGMMRLKGSAKGVDLATLMYENKRIVVRLQAFMRFVEDRFAVLHTALNVQDRAQGMQQYIKRETMQFDPYALVGKFS